MNERELTIKDVLTDPLIRQVMNADHISLADMTNLLDKAARNQKRCRRKLSLNSCHDTSAKFSNVAPCA